MRQKTRRTTHKGHLLTSAGISWVGQHLRNKTRILGVNRPVNTISKKHQVSLSQRRKMQAQGEVKVSIRSDGGMQSKHQAWLCHPGQ